MTPSKYIESLEELRKRNKDQLHDAAFKWNEFANERLSDLSKHLFTISSILLPLSILPLTNKDLLNILTVNKIICLMAALTLIFSSFVLGLTHLLSEAEFFKKWAEQESKRSKIYSDSILTSTPIPAYKRFNKMNHDSNLLAKLKSNPKPIYLYLQSITLVLGFLIISLVFLLSIPLINLSTSTKNTYQKMNNYKYLRDNYHNNFYNKDSNN